MGKTQEELKADDHRTPFEKFDTLMSGLMEVSKDELDMALEAEKLEKNVEKKKASKSFQVLRFPLTCPKSIYITKVMTIAYFQN